MNHAKDQEEKQPAFNPVIPAAANISYPKINKSELPREEYGTGSQFYRFGSEVKRRFLEIAPKVWPNVGKMCRAVGISRQTYHNHMQVDPVFRAAMEEIRESKLDDLEEINVNEGHTTGREAFLPRISTLKAYRKAIYDPARVVHVEGLQMGAGERRQRIGGLENAIDAEVTRTYLDRKQIREANRQKNSDGAEGTGRGQKKIGGADQ